MERINQLCYEFTERLAKDRKRNFEAHPFYPNGTAKDLFRKDEEKLHELFRALFHADRLDTSLVPALVQRTLVDLSTVLAIILRVRERGDNLILRQFTHLVISNSRIKESPGLTDRELPIPLSEAVYLFPHRANEFFDTQFQFCGITLTRGEHVISPHAQCPLPYEEQEEIGFGAYGNVYQVKIAAHHFRSDGDENIRPKLLARKDFRKKAAFVAELDVLKKIMDQPEKHDHLVMVHAALEHRGVGSLFFPLADCDLHQYLNGEYRTTRTTPRALGEKSAIYRRSVALAGALGFLHGVCMHLDLKPRNILVYNAGDANNETWKITDFGLTRVKNTDPEYNENSVTTPGVEGTYLPPECALRNGKVTTQSDVWSLGCILSLVITYIVFGPRGVRTFADKRGERPEGDAFYITTRGSTPRISPAVTYWFDLLKKSASGDIDSRVVRASLDYLQSKVLHPIRHQRASAKDVERAFRRINELWNEQPTQPSSGHPLSKTSSIHARIRVWLTQRSSDSSYSRLANLHYHVKGRVLGFKFSPSVGDFLALFSAQGILVWTVSQITSALENKSHIPPPQSISVNDSSIKCFSVSSYSICNGLDGDSFRCYIHIISEPSSDTIMDRGVKVSYDHLGAIKKTAMSRDGAMTAFVITGRPGGPETDCRIYLAYTQHLIDTADGSYPLPRSSWSNSEVSENSFVSVTTAANLIVDREDVGSADRIRFLDFTPDGKFLVILVQDGTNGFSIRSWETYSGRCFGEFFVTVESPQSSRSLFTACSIFVSESVEPCLVIVTDHRRIIRVNLFRRTCSDRMLGVDVECMSVCDDGETLVVIGKKRGQSAYLLPAHPPDRLDVIRIAKINDVSYKSLLDDAAVRKHGDKGLKLLIASSSGSFLEMSISY